MKEKTLRNRWAMVRVLLVSSIIMAVMLAFPLYGRAAGEAVTQEGFDYTRYADENPDVKAAFGYDISMLWLHYTQCGIAEGRAAYNIPGYSKQTETVTGESANTLEEKMRARIIELVNIERTSRGIPPLATNDAINAAAQLRATETIQIYEHIRPDGTEPDTALDAFGVEWGLCGENIYKTPRTPEAAMEGWMRSPGHRENILEGSYRLIGVGFAVDGRGTYYWTQMFVDCE